MRMTYLDAGRAALAEEMRRDPMVWAVGEDLGRGGVFGQYRGLREEFGPERISDAPISEAAIMGASVGAAMMGTRPVVEMRFSDFALCAIDELVNQAAKARFMLGGRTTVPVVFHGPQGGGIRLAAQHPQSLKAWFAHVPGLVVLAPSNLFDAKGLMAAATATTIALGRVGQTDDIAKVVAFLASPDGGWVTGQCIDASSGQRL